MEAVLLLEITRYSVGHGASGRYHLPLRVQGKVYVWKINDDQSNLPRFQAVTKFEAHKKYLTRCVLSPDVKCAFSFYYAPRSTN
jgi:hypothetical protein